MYIAGIIHEVISCTSHRINFKYFFNEVRSIFTLIRYYYLLICKKCTKLKTKGP